MGQPKEIIPNLWLHEAVAAGVGARAAALVGERRAVFWDTLSRPRDISALAPILGDKPFYVVYSHADWDHCWGTSGFRRPPLAIVGHEECRRRFEFEVPQTLDSMQAADPEAWNQVRLMPPDFTFSTRMNLDLGAVTLELHHLPGHTTDCIVGWIPEWGVMLGGDAIETPLPVLNAKSEPLLGAWLSALEAWASKPGLKRSIPSHGSTSGRKALDRTIAYLQSLTGGQDFKLPQRLDKFYRETHRNNLQLLARSSD